MHINLFFQIAWMMAVFPIFMFLSFQVQWSVTGPSLTFCYQYLVLSLITLSGNTFTTLAFVIFRMTSRIPVGRSPIQWYPLITETFWWNLSRPWGKTTLRYFAQFAQIKCWHADKIYHNNYAGFRKRHVEPGVEY